MKRLNHIITKLCRAKQSGVVFPNDLAKRFEKPTELSPYEFNAAFICVICGAEHPEYQHALSVMEYAKNNSEHSVIARFYLDGLRLIQQEISQRCSDDFEFDTALTKLDKELGHNESWQSEERPPDIFWKVFFPEALGIGKDEQAEVDALREKRKVPISHLNSKPIDNPAVEILFTSNALLTIPKSSALIDSLELTEDLKDKLKEAVREPQLYWYDHPIPVGVPAHENEILYGLKGLNDTVAFEKKAGVLPENARLKCVLSVSVTHKGLQNLAKNYIEQTLAKSDSLDHIDVCVYTEADTEKIIDQILVPAAEHYLKIHNAKNKFQVLGVDGEYGRHYSFLKAISAFWSVILDDRVKGTFKIDLDQVFPQNELVAQTGCTALQHLKTPLWGAKGTDSFGNAVELGMIAGALVNESDIDTSLFTADVKFPSGVSSLDEYVFFSQMPQALSTEAEMMLRYTNGKIDGIESCIQRIHVTGGTNGILVDHLLKYRPFTPSFIARAEDQAYLFSTLFNRDPRLAYAHKDGLIMRHDKEAFAGDAIKASAVGKLIGDYIRILYFSAYTKILCGKFNKVKQQINPFTGCFVSKIPVTIVFLRFALKAQAMFQTSKEQDAVEFITSGAPRISAALKFISGEHSELSKTFIEERDGWDLYYDTLQALADALGSQDSFALDLQCRARKLNASITIRTEALKNA